MMHSYQNLVISYFKKVLQYCSRSEDDGIKRDISELKDEIIYLKRPGLV